MKVFKFGGASVNSATAVKNVAEILSKNTDEKILTVISAMGKTTNSLENLTNEFFNRTDKKYAIFEEIKSFHFNIINELFTDKSHHIFLKINELFNLLYKKIITSPTDNFDFEYDQIVCYGELISTSIVSNYLTNCQLKNRWIDAREIIRTDLTYREGKVDWIFTNSCIKQIILPFFTKSDNLIITQGFIGGGRGNHSVTLGREGSDYSAAIFAYGLNASSMTIWKDVPGLLNADPKFFEDTKKIDFISYREAIELAYYGATIIHPKTIKPLQNKNIPLYVKSFLNPENEGSVISNIEKTEEIIPSFIFKKNQALVSISPKDFSFIAEENLSEIFKIITKNQIKINLMQNSAISFSICMDADNRHFEKLIGDLQLNFKVKYNKNLDLITIRHYNQAIIDKVVNNRKILLEQKSRLTAQLIVENLTIN